jgi:hypothetical protein
MARSVMAAGWFKRTPLGPGERAGGGAGGRPPRDEQGTEERGAPRAGLSGAVRAGDLTGKPPLLRPPL